MTNRLKTLILILIFVLLYGIYYWVVPVVVDIQHKVPMIENFANSKLGIKLKLQNPRLKMGLLPSIWIKADEFALLDNNGNKPPLLLKKPVIKVQLIPLLWGKIQFKYFSADYINAQMKFDKNMRFYLGNQMLIGNANPRISFEDSQVFIDEYNINLKDEFQNKNIKINGDYFDLYKFNSKKYVDLATNSRIVVNKTVSTISASVNFRMPIKNNFNGQDVDFSGAVTGLDLADFSPYIRKFSKNKILNTSGILNIESKTQKQKSGVNRIVSALALDNLYIKLKGGISSVNYPGKLKVNSILEVSNNKLNILKLSVNARNINAKVNGEISKIKSKKQKVKVDVTINNSRSEAIIGLVPGIKLSNSQVDLYSLKKYNFYSDVNGKLSFRGPSDNPKVYGKVLAENAYVIKPIQNAPKAHVLVSFFGNKMKLDVKVPVSKSESVKVFGTIKLFGLHDADLDVISTPSVDLKTVQSVLVPVHEVFYFDIGPVPIMDIHGLGNIVLKIRGNKLKPHLIGEFSFRNGAVSFNNINAVVKNAVGHLIFSDKTTHFYTTSASFNSKPIKIDGTCSLTGVLDFKVTAKNQNANALLNILKSSPMLSGVVNQVSMLNKADGLLDLALEITGKAKDINNIKFNKNIFASGAIALNGVNISLKDVKVPIKKAFGTVKFKDGEVYADIHSLLGKSNLFAKGVIKKNAVNMQVNSDSLYLSDIICYITKFDPSCNPSIYSFSNAHIKLNTIYNGPIKFDIKKLKMDAKFLPPTTSKTDLAIYGGKISLIHGKISVNKLLGNYKGNQFNANGNISNIFNSQPDVNATIYSDNFDFSVLKYLINYPFIPAKTRQFIAKFSNINGKEKVKLTIKNNKLNTKIRLKGLSFVYNKLGLPVKMYSGYAELSGDKIILYRANALADTMPVLADGVIDNIFAKPNLNLYINSKPIQKFVDKYINKDSLYPLRIKGDTLYSARVKGPLDKLAVKAEVNLSQDAYIQYMGGSIGDSENPIRIFINSKIQKNKIELSEFQYDKLISSQNNKEFVTPQLFAKGVINFAGNNIYLHNLRVATQNPTDAKIFNILFKKSIAKQGNFTSNILVNGSVYSPNIAGDISFTGVDIPILDTTLKDITLDFKGNKIYIKAAGEVLANKILLDAVMHNTLVAPYKFESINLLCDNLDLNDVTKSISNFQDELAKRKISSDKQVFDVKDLTIKNATIKAKKVYVKGIRANDFYSDLTLDDEKLLTLDNFKFNVADGKVKGAFKYSFFNNKTDLNMSVENANANELADALFDLPDQLYGAINGNVSLYCNGRTHKSCMDTLGGYGGFEVKHGRMPKLGSLEYLLKAANLVKSGFTGLTVNNVVDMITPLKTGDFDSIRGDFKISSGIAHPIEIYSKGKDLDLFIDGNYNFSTATADMNVFGRLSKKISTVFGPVGNASINTLFNIIPGLHLDDPNNSEFINQLGKIPGFELNDKLYRIFSAKIYGDINGENYVQSFKWVE